MTLELRPVQVDTDSPDEHGRLVFEAGRLVAVLVQLSRQHGAQAGHWFLEHGFGRLDGPKRPTFPDIGTAERWIADHLARGREGRPMRRRLGPGTGSRQDRPRTGLSEP